jgi:hypothetical protein
MDHSCLSRAQSQEDDQYLFCSAEIEPMIDTRLILIEGVPCSGKSTTAETLVVDISAEGIKADCYLEWSADNPIFIGEMENLDDIIRTTRSREADVFRQWTDFTQLAKQQNSVHIMESRFWQTHGMYLYLSGHPEEEVVRSTNQLISIIAEINPVLIYLAPTNIEALHVQIAGEKNRKWREEGREGSWEDWGNRIYEQQGWFTQRSLTSAAIGRFFQEWDSIAGQLFAACPFRKIKVQDPQLDWKKSLGRIKDFLEIQGS